MPVAASDGTHTSSESAGVHSSMSGDTSCTGVSATTGTYTPVPGPTATNTVTVGTFAGRLHQDGAEFPYASDSARLNATVTFTWTRDGKRIGQVSQTTTGGHPQADFGQPPNHSSATCKF